MQYIENDSRPPTDEILKKLKQRGRRMVAIANDSHETPGAGIPVPHVQQHNHSEKSNS